MNEALRLTKKALTWGVVATTIAWSVGMAALPIAASAATLSAGSLIKGSLPAVYYYASNGKRYVFPALKTYSTWYANFSGVQTISDADLASISIGGNVMNRAGTRLVKIQSIPMTYAVEPGGKLRWITSEAIAKALWGNSWSARVDDVSDAFFTNYTSGTDISSNAYPAGSLVQTAVGSDIWYINGATKRKVTAAGMSGNNFRAEFVNVTSIDLSGLTVGTDITGMESALSDASQTGGNVVPPGPVASGLSVMASSDTPAGTTIVGDNTGTKSQQSLIPVLKLHFTASADGAVTVNTVKLTRSGISSDADIQDMYLYDGDSFGTQLAKAGSIAGGKVSFNVPAGIFTVPAGGSKDVMVRLDMAQMADAASGGKTYAFSLASADVTPATAGTLVSGSANGSTFTVAAVSDLGRMELKNINPATKTTVDPQNGYELWRFQVKAQDQTMLLKSLRLTNTGSIGANDVQNLALYDGSTLLGAVVPSLSSNVAMFDLSGMTNGGLKLISGASKQLSLRGDIVGGTNRTYNFTVQNTTDAMIYDTNYNVYTRPVTGDNGTSFSVVQPGGATTINTGKLTIQKASDSPSTNVPKGATNVVLAKWNFTAAGEDVKVDNLSAACTGNDVALKLLNVRMIFDGAQAGTTLTSLTCNNIASAAFSFGNSFVVPAGTTKTLVINADLSDITVITNDTIIMNLPAGTANAAGKTSLTAINTSASSANSVTVKTGALVATIDNSFSNRTISNPTGVMGATGVNLAQFVVTGGGEDSDISQIVLKDTADAVNLATYFQNLKLWDDKGAQIGNTVGALTATDGTTYTFNPSTPIRVVAGGSRSFKITGDILTGLSVTSRDSLNALTAGEVYPSSISATGVTTGVDTSDSDGTNAGLQTMYIAANGNLSVYPDSATPISQTMVLGSTANELARFTLTANQNEDINVTKMVISDFMTNGGATSTPGFSATGTIKNVKLIDVSTGTQYGGTVTSLDSSASAGGTSTPVAAFDNISNLKVLRNNSIVLKVVGDLTAYSDGGMSSSSQKLGILPNFIYTEGVNWATEGTTNLSITATGQDSGFAISGSSLDFNASSSNSDTDAIVYGNAMNMFRTKITIAKAADAPSGLSSGASEQTVAKFVVTNSANVGNYSASLALMDVNIGTTISPSNLVRNIKVYKDSVQAGNQLASTSQNVIGGSFLGTAAKTGFALNGGTFSSIDISAGASRTVIVTIDTSDATTQKNLTVGIPAGGVLWSDGVTSSITVLDSLPLTGNTLTY